MANFHYNNQDYYKKIKKQALIYLNVQYFERSILHKHDIR